MSDTINYTLARTLALNALETLWDGVSERGEDHKFVCGEITRAAFIKDDPQAGRLEVDYLSGLVAAFSN